MSTLGVIPARWGSTRFPGKALAMIGNRPMVWHVYQRCLESRCLDRIVVATDDKRIEAACRKLCIPTEMTGAHHRNGTERVAEVARRVKADWYVNVQGDEPFVHPKAIRKVVQEARLGQLPTNGCAEISDPADVVDTNVIKVAMTADRTAVFLSRTPIPYPKSRGVRHHCQVMVYAFDPDDLAFYMQHEPGPLERSEGIELLRFLEYGRDVRMVVVPPSPLSVDTPEDLARAQAYFHAHRNRRGRG